jgi:hypothetical protein
MHIPREANQVVDSLVKSIACKVVGPCKYSKFACDFIVIPLVADIHVSLFLCAVSTSIVRGLRPPLFQIFFLVLKLQAVAVTIAVVKGMPNSTNEPRMIIIKFYFYELGKEN